MRRIAVAAAAAVALLAGIVVLVAAAWFGDRCETLPDAVDPATTHEVCGGFLERYRTDDLGLPRSDEQPVTLESVRPYGDREMDFDRGTVYLDRRTGETSVGRWEFYTPVR